MPDPVIDVFIPGKPAPQGSKKYLGNGISVESSKAVKPWRADIRDSLGLPVHWTPLTGAVSVSLAFVMPRPASAPKKRTPPAIKRPDLDKLTRAVLDAIGSAGVYLDDSQVTHMHVTKRLAQIGEPSGVHINIEETER